MSCKNCQSALPNSAKYCQTCGAKVIHERFSLKLLWKDLTKEVFGWDTKYFITLKHLILKPDILLKEYLGGTRKRYVNPLTFLTIGAALSVLCFSLFSDDYKSLINNLSSPPSTELVQDSTQTAISPELLAEDSVLSHKESRAEQEADKPTKRVAFDDQTQEDILKYFNLFTYLTLPVYTLFAFWTFGKPYNYAEHLVINSYLQGLLFLVGIIGFFLSITVHSSIYAWSLALGIAYYSYAYGKLYQHNWKQVILKLLKFLGMLLTIIFLIVIVGFLYAKFTT